MSVIAFTCAAVANTLRAKPRRVRARLEGSWAREEGQRTSGPSASTQASVLTELPVPATCADA